MISIPVAAPIFYFKWQISLFQFAQKQIYGEINSFRNNLILIVDRNDNKTIIKDVDWSLRIPYKVVNGIHSILSETNPHEHFVVGNVFFALTQIVNNFNEEEVICLTDADVIPLKQYNGPLPEDDTIITCNYYENWHMKFTKPNKENFNIVKSYLKHDIYDYMDGGFVPIIIKIKTLKKILNETINLTIEIVNKHKGTSFGWWSQMFAFQIACHNNKIKCIGQDNTYFPGINELNIENHYFAHYSCDPKFKKSNFPNHNISEFPNNIFYNLIKEWYSR